MDEYVTAARELEDDLLLERKSEVQRQQMKIAEGDVSKYIKDVWEVEVSNQRLEDESTKLRQRADLRQFVIAKMIGGRIDNPDESGTVMNQQWRWYLYALSIFWNIYGEMEEGESLMTLICGGIEQQNIFRAICKWMVDDEAEWPQENEMLFHLLKEN